MKRILSGFGLFLLGAALALCWQMAQGAYVECQARAEICTD